MLFTCSFMWADKAVIITPPCLGGGCRSEGEMMRMEREIKNHNSIGEKKDVRTKEETQARNKLLIQCCIF